MTTFQEDWDSAYKEVYKPLKMPDLPAKKRTKKINKPGQHMNKLKKKGPSKQVLSENAKQQPRQGGKFASKSGFWTRLGWLFNGKAKRKVNASRRAARQMDARMGRASIPVERRKRTRRRRKSTPSAHPQYRKSVFRQILGF